MSQILHQMLLAQARRVRGRSYTFDTSDTCAGMKGRSYTFYTLDTHVVVRGRSYTYYTSDTCVG